MNFLKRNGITLLLLAGLAAYVYVAGKSRSCGICTAITDTVGLTSSPSATLTPPSGTEAVPWSGRTLDGTPLSAESLRGKVVLVDFWATWCPPCRKAIPDLVALQERFAARGLQVVGISLDEGASSKVASFARANNMNYPVMMGAESSWSAFGRIEAIPTLFILNREGQVVGKHVGHVPLKQLEAEISALM